MGVDCILSLCILEFMYNVSECVFVVWSLSPYYYNSYANMFNINTNGRMNENNVNYTSGAAAPVINLSADYTGSLRGSGTITDPYVMS